MIQDHMKVPQKGKLHCRGGLNCLRLLMRRGVDWIGNRERQGEQQYGCTHYRRRCRLVAPLWRILLVQVKMNACAAILILGLSLQAMARSSWHHNSCACLSLPLINCAIRSPPHHNLYLNETLKYAVTSLDRSA